MGESIGVPTFLKQNWRKNTASQPRHQKILILESQNLCSDFADIINKPEYFRYYLPTNRDDHGPIVVKLSLYFGKWIFEREYRFKRLKSPRLSSSLYKLSTCFHDNVILNRRTRQCLKTTYFTLRRVSKLLYFLDHLYGHHYHVECYVS